MPDGPKPQPMTLRAFARRMGCSPQNVSRAIQTGRLERSVARIQGRPFIADVALPRKSGSTTSTR